MGGDYYDRDVVSSSNIYGYSDSSNSIIGTQTNLHKSLNPQRFTEDILICESLNPIVFALDVTGSMGSWSKIIYDKMPMFYGQIMMQKYLADPSVSFCAIGDSKYDKIPLQVSEFGKGTEIDQLISKICLEGGGGPNFEESYEMSVFFYQNYCNLKNSEYPFFFITGDEGFFPEIAKNDILNVFGKEYKDNIDSFEVFSKITKKFNVFLLKKEYSKKENEIIILKQWEKAIGSVRILPIKTPKACIDIILGAIAITVGKRDLDSYISDMKIRGQDESRIKEVSEALHFLNLAKISGDLEIVKNSTLYKEDYIKKNLQTLKEKYLTSEEIFKLEMLKNNIHLLNENFICKLTGEPFLEPVLLDNGQTFEKYAIEEWFSLGNINNPFDESPKSLKLTPNTFLKKMCTTAYSKIL